jgi:hypothetical protein
MQPDRRRDGEARGLGRRVRGRPSLNLECEQALDRARSTWNRPELEEMTEWGGIGADTVALRDAIDQAYDALDGSDEQARATVDSIIDRGKDLSARLVTLSRLCRYRIVPMARKRKGQRR